MRPDPFAPTAMAGASFAGALAILSLDKAKLDVPLQLSIGAFAVAIPMCVCAAIVCHEYRQEPDDALPPATARVGALGTYAASVGIAMLFLHFGHLFFWLYVAAACAAIYFLRARG